jgi:Pvc16 N-terminal domain
MRGRATLGHVISDLDASITAWLSDLVPYAEISLDAPPTGQPADSGRPTLCLALVDVQEDQSAGSHSWSTERSGDGQVVGRLPPQRRYRFTYLVTACGRDTRTEHEALGVLLAGLALEDVVPDPFLRGVLEDCHQTVLVRCAPERATTDDRERWGAWSWARRTALELVVLAPLPAAAVQAVADPPSHIDLRSSGSYRPAATAGATAPRRPSGRITEA